MATSLKESKKDVRIEKIHAKIMKIGLVDPEIDPEIALLMLNKKKINASKIYIPSGKFTERSK